MSQESTMICVDNSEWMRNGDLPPTRFNCQQEAVRALIHYKLRSNPENAVGLLSLANRIDVLNSLSTEDRKLMIRLHSLSINGVALILDGVKTAYLALKHRKNRNHRQRIVVFVGSPLDPLIKEKQAFLKFAKKLKKEKVSADFVLFGEATAENNEIVAEFVNILNGAEGTGSHLLVVPAGDTKLYDALLRSPICEGAATGAAMGAGGDFGINDEDDPELAMALRISLEEQRLRQQQQQGAQEAGDQGQQQGGEAPAADVAAMEVDQPAAEPPAIAAQVHNPDFGTMTEQEQLDYALRLSIADNQSGQDSGSQDGQQTQQQSRSPSMALSTPAPTPMETEEGTSGNSGNAAVGGVQPGELMQHPEILKKLIDQVPSSGDEKKKDQQEEKKDDSDDSKQ